MQIAHTNNFLSASSGESDSIQAVSFWIHGIAVIICDYHVAIISNTQLLGLDYSRMTSVPELSAKKQIRETHPGSWGMTRASFFAMHRINPTTKWLDESLPPGLDQKEIMGAASDSK